VPRSGLEIRRNNDMTASATYLVAGMTCGHCANAVTEEITKLGGVSDVRVAIVPGGESSVTVFSLSPLFDADIAAALDEAGDYSLVEV
jgi:copper chaperone CopZ